MAAAKPQTSAASAVKRKAALVSWARTADRSARTAPGRLASARAQIRNLEATLNDDGAT
jgi:hypothetical protein